MKIRRIFGFIACCLMLSVGASFGQTATFAALTGGLQPVATPITSGQSQVVLIGFSAQVSGGSINFTQFNIGWTTSSNSQSHLANGTLFRSPTSTFNAATSIPVGNVTFSGSNIAINSLTETISNSTNYYFLVADAVYSNATTTDYNGQIYINSGTFAVDNNSAVYAGYVNDYLSYTFNSGTTPYPVIVSNNTMGTSPSATTLSASSSNVALFGFTVTTSGNYTFTGVNVNSNLASLSTYFGSFQLWSGTIDGFANSSNTGATVTLSGSYARFTGSFVVNSATKYFYLVATPTGLGTFPATVQFNVSSGQSTSALQTAGTSYNDFTATGNTYNVNGATVTVTSQTGGTSGTTIALNQSNIVLFGFGISASSSIIVSAFNINSSNGSTSTYFGNGKLYSSPTSTYSAATATQVGTAVFSGSYANVTLTTNQTINSTAKYYFLVADNIGAGAGAGTTVAFSFVSGQSTSAVIQTSPSSSYNTFNINGNTYSLPNPSLIVTGANSTSTNGITSGNLVYGEKDIVLYGFGMQASGSPYTLNTFNIKTSGAENSYFSNARLYRSATPVFSAATLVYGSAATQGSAGVFVSGGGYFNCTVNETIPSGTTYYYWLVADFTVNFGASGIFTCSFANGQTSPAFILNSPYVTYNTYNVTGNGFNIVTSEYWIGAISGDITNALNFQALNGGNGSIPNSSIVVNIGGIAYTNAPTITANAAIGGITFGTTVANPVLNISAGKTLTLNNALTVSSSNATISGGSIALASTAISTSGASSLLTLNNTVLSNAGTYNMVSASQVTLSGSSTISNTGTINNNGTFAVNSGVTSTISGTGGNFNIGIGGALTIAGTLTNSNALNINSGVTAALGVTGTLNLNGPLTVSSGAVATISGTGGVLNVGTGGSLSVAGTLNANNSLAVNTGVTTTFGVTGALTINKSLTINSGATTTTSGAGGNVNVAPGAIVNINGTGKLIQNLSSGGAFTLKSDATGSASLGQLTTGTVTGIFNVERFITGGVGHRGYMLLSSPVYAAAVSPNNVYDLHYLTNASGGMYLTGTTGFDKGGNPSLYLYREDVPFSNVGFTGGNFQGVSTFNNSNVYDYNVNNGPTTYNMPAGNGYMVFFRGNRTAATLAQETVSTFTTAPTVTLVSAGTLNTGSITVHDWFNPSSGNISFTTAIANASVRGFNLVGNPYASSIDWENFSSTTSTAGIYGPNVSNIVYEYNIITHNYDTYQVGGAFTNNGTRTIVSGQGFFVQADTTLAALTFNETAKSTIQNTGSNLFMTTRADIEKVKSPAPNQYVLLEMALDSVNKDNTYIGFNTTAKQRYIVNEDALYNPGTGKVSLSSLSGDNRPLAINKMPYPTTVSDTIRLKIGAQAAGAYTLKMTNMESIPDLYEIWLKDAYTKDSLNMRQNPLYTFNVDFSNAATYGASRFSVIIRQNYAKRLHLLSFGADKITKGVQVSWKTENEKSYTVFTVERSVDKGITFSAIGGFTSSAQGAYSLGDNNPLNGENQYRLKLMDVNGDITYSKVVTVSYLNSTAGDTHNLLIYPNPVRNTLYLLITNTNLTSGFSAEQVTSISSLLPVLTAKADQYSITIVNNLGAVVKKADTNVPVWQTDVSNLLPGSYVLQVISKTGKGIIGQTTFIKL
jgi:hypothetical protein